MKNIHTLPTEKPSRLKQNKITKKYSLVTKGIDLTMYTPQNIYIDSDVMDINENDYIITQDGRLVQVSYLLSKDLEGASKIILTTDQDLINDGVQAIDDDFLEWFVKNPSCERVGVDKYHGIDTSIAEVNAISGDGSLNWQGRSDLRDYKIIIPKEEAKQETLEEAAERFYNTEDLQRDCTFIEGAKWQQEQDKNKYSAEEQTDILEVGQILVNEETLEYGLLQYIKICLECNNESQAIRLLEKYGFEKQEERYSEEEVLEILNKFSASCYSPIEKFEIPEWLKKNKNK